RLGEPLAQLLLAALDALRHPGEVVAEVLLPVPVRVLALAVAVVAWRLRLALERQRRREAEQHRGDVALVLDRSPVRDLRAEAAVEVARAHDAAHARRREHRLLPRAPIEVRREVLREAALALLPPLVAASLHRR